MSVNVAEDRDAGKTLAQCLMKAAGPSFRIRAAIVQKYAGHNFAPSCHNPRPDRMKKPDVRGLLRCPRRIRDGDAIIRALENKVPATNFVSLPKFHFAMMHDL
jgi:hypothetical protein